MPVTEKKGLNFYYLSLLIVCTCFIGRAEAQKTFPEEEVLRKQFTDRKKSKVLILGTFHFKDAGRDSYKPKFSVDIQSPERQKEVKELVDILARFNPTKVTIENMQEYQPFHDSLYGEYLRGQYKLGDNEIFQVCYRLAALMKHQKVYTIDAPSRRFEPPVKLDSFTIAHRQEHFRDTVYSSLYNSLYAMDDSIKSVLPLKASLTRVNEPDRLLLGLGHYLIGDFKVAADGHYAGADAAIYWWSRNLRIFSNILQLATQTSEERIFVMIGSGHLPILRFLAMSTPEIEFIDAYEYLKKN